MLMFMWSLEALKSQVSELQKTSSINRTERSQVPLLRHVSAFEQIAEGVLAGNGKAASTPEHVLSAQT